MKQQGPKKITIPEQNFYSCYGCEFHKSKLVQSGRNPVRADNCTHPSFPIKQNDFSGNLSKNKDDHIETPSICPFLIKDRDSVGTYGHGSSGQFMRTQIDFDGR